MLRFWPLSFVVLCCALSSVSLPAHSQDLQVGIRNGVVRSTVHGDIFYPSLALEGGRVNKRMQTGLQITGFLALPLSDHVSLQVELQYAQKGASIRGEWAPPACGGPLVVCIVPSLDGTYRLSYVQLPVLLKWQFFGGNAASIHAVIGPSLDVLQDTHITTETLHPSALPGNALQPKSDAELGAVGGLEAQYDVSSAGAIVLSARYHPGVTETDLIGGDSSLRNRAFVFSLGYAFRP